MIAPYPSPEPAKSVMLVAPQAPPYGGMALQARLLKEFLEGDGTLVRFCASNFALMGPLSLFERVPLARTAIRAIAVWGKLSKEMEAVDAVHVFAASWLYFFLVVAPAIVTGKRLGKRVVVNYRGGDAARFFRWWGWAAGPLLRRADIVTAPSRFLAETIRRHFAIPVTIVKNLLDGSAFRHRRRVAIAPKMIVARHLEKSYGIESVLRAFQSIQQHYPEASLAVLGTGTQEESLRRLAAEWNLRNVKFFGHVTHDELPVIYDSYDIFLNGSFIDNFPGALLEASAAGLVVVSTAAGGIPIMYENGKDALLVEPGDWQALADAAKKVLASPSLAQRLIQGGEALAESCSWKNIRQSLYSAYGFSQPDAVSSGTAIAGN